MTLVIDTSLTTKELQKAEKHASSMWHKFTDNGTQINTPWLAEYEKECTRLEREKEWAQS